jgi:16S rRNA (cytosine1402-N4)-methyltransferase
MAAEAVAMLLAGRRGLFVDATVGTGGHAELILRESGEGVELLGIDRDRRALEADGFLLDLGVSSLQLSDRMRGFSYLADGPLDMAMGANGHSVRDLLATAEEREIGRIIRDYGEERRARAIARQVVRQRTTSAIDTTAGLRRSVERAVSRRDVMGTLSRVFQAFRIWANDELESLSEFLPDSLERLNAGGRIVVISYHSLEDRIVKRFFRQEEKGCICPVDVPECRCGRSPRLRVVTRSAVRPSRQEIERNPRSRSARLRAAERL